MPDPIVQLPDYHTHTVLCQHAEGRPADYVREAERKALPEIACTDHGPAPEHFDPQHRMIAKSFATYRQWVMEARANARCTVLFGVEADYHEGCEVYLADWLKREEFDLVLGSIHYIGLWDLWDPAKQASWTADDIFNAWNTYFGFLRQMATSRMYDVVAHLDLPKRTGLRPPDGRYRELVLPVLDDLAAAGMGIELNTSGLLHPCREIYPSVELLAWARERDIPITFGSDAHSPQRVGADFDKAIEHAKAAGYTQSLRFNRRQKTLRPF